MSDDSSTDGPQSSSTSNDALLGLSSAYETNHPPELELPPPTDELELEEISPKDISIDQTEEQNDTNKTPPENPFGEPPSASGVPPNWKPNKIMRRADWGAAKPKWIESLDIPVDKVVVSFTETDSCFTEEECRKFIKNLQEQHMKEKDVPDIKHNFLIGGDEVIYEGRGYMRKGPIYKPSPKKIEELNGKSIDIAIIARSTLQPRSEALRAISFMLAKGVHEQFIIEGFYTYYVVGNEIASIQPPNNQMKLT